MATPNVYEQATDYANRANPFPLYSELRQQPVLRLDDGTYVISTYQEVLSLFHDPRVSSDLRKRSASPAHASSSEPKTQDNQASDAQADHPSDKQPNISELDPPDHDRVRRQANRQFGPPHKPRRIYDMQGTLNRIVNDLINDFKTETEIDLIEHFAYRFPVKVICELLAVPHEDESRIHEWTLALSSPNDLAEIKETSARAFEQIDAYMVELLEKRRHALGDDMLSGYIIDSGPDGQMALADMVATASLLLSAGHETTVNLIGNGILTLLRHPEIIERLQREPDLIIKTIEELLRYESPVQFLHQRTALADIDIAGVTIPKGSPLLLMLGCANRDSDRFADPDRFDPEREDNQHLGFGSGIHSCFGAPLARLEGQIALSTLFRRLENPRLVVDPPPYRKNPMVRGPSELRVTFDRVID